MKIESIYKKLLFNTLRLEVLDASNNPVSIGTSFLLSHAARTGTEEVFVVTNKHVVAPGSSCNVVFTGSKDGVPQIGSQFKLRMDDIQASFHAHPDTSVDVVVCPLPGHFGAIDQDGLTAYYTKLSTELIPDPDELANIDAFQEVIFIGYPRGLYDPVNLVPITRRGVTATPVELDFDGKSAFLIDASVFPGSSGSPVFAIDRSISPETVNPQLLGIVTSVYTRTEKGFVLQPAPHATTTGAPKYKQMIDIGVVTKSQRIIETIEDYDAKR